MPVDLENNILYRPNDPKQSVPPKSSDRTGFTVPPVPVLLSTPSAPLPHHTQHHASPFFQAGACWGTWTSNPPDPFAESDQSRFFHIGSCHNAFDELLLNAPEQIGPANLQIDHTCGDGSMGEEGMEDNQCAGDDLDCSHDPRMDAHTMFGEQGCGDVLRETGSQQWLHDVRSPQIEKIHSSSDYLSTGGGSYSEHHDQAIHLDDDSHSIANLQAEQLGLLPCISDPQDDTALELPLVKSLYPTSLPNEVGIPEIDEAACAPSSSSEVHTPLPLQAGADDDQANESLKMSIQDEQIAHLESSNALSATRTPTEQPSVTFTDAFPKVSVVIPVRRPLRR